MPKHVRMSDYEIITDGGRRRRWTAAKKLRIVEETPEDGASISVVARRNGVAKALLRRIIEVATRAVPCRIQQEFFDNFDRYASDTALPQQSPGDVRIELDLPEPELDAARGDLIEIAMEGSEWIWRSTSDGQAAAVFEVICDILEEGLSPKDQQALLDANLSDVAG